MALSQYFPLRFSHGAEAIDSNSANTQQADVPLMKIHACSHSAESALDGQAARQPAGPMGLRRTPGRLGLWFLELP